MDKKKPRSMVGLLGESLRIRCEFLLSDLELADKMLDRIEGRADADAARIRSNAQITLETVQQLYSRIRPTPGEAKAVEAIISKLSMRLKLARSD